MPLSDFLYVLRFWFVYFVLGLIVFPITSRIFSRFIDKGWIFSKTIGIISITFLMWVAASFKILPFTSSSLLIIVSLISLLSLITLSHSHYSIVSPARIALRSMAGRLLHCPRKRLLLIFVEEILFFACLLLWSYIRGFQPTIEGLEKYMDFGFINAILRSTYFPPHDMWLSGSTINYYYFGHLIAAVIVRLSQIPPEIVYNLMIAVIFALCFTSSFSIGINIFYHFLKDKFQKLLPFNFYLLTCGLLTAYLITNAANLQPIYHLSTKGSASYWYPDATRFIVRKFGASDETIHEFPHYSFVVADLHGHVSDIPTVLLLIAFCFILFLKIVSTDNPKSPRFPLSPLSIYDSLLLGFLLSVAYMTNAMDGPIYFALSGLTVFGSLWYKTKNLSLSTIKSAVFFFFTALTFIICSFPFLLNFKNFTGGIKLVDFRTPLWMLGILWGFQYYMGLGFIIFLFFNKVVNKEFLIKNIGNFFGMKIKIVREKLKSKTEKINLIDFFILFLIILATFLIIFPEIFYIKDIYIHEYERANTMFKMTYQAFILLYIAAPYIFFRILYHIKTRIQMKLLFPAFLFITFAILGLVSVSIYPYFAVKSYYGLVTYQGLDGLKYLKTLYPDDYKLIKLLNSEGSPLRSPVPDGAGRRVILEAVGDSYTKYARISANTGISTVLGWPVHEWLWRNGYDIPGRRTADIKTIYESISIPETENLLKEYKVNYIWVGQLEREKYLNLNEKKFEEIGKPVLRFGNSVLYKI